MLLLLYLLYYIYYIGELPLTIDFVPYDDRNPGCYNITIIANSTMGEIANHTIEFRVPGRRSMIYDHYIDFCHHFLLLH